MNDIAPPDFRTLFESSPGLYLVLTRDLRIAAVSNAYLRATMTTREGILGRGIFDAFPDNPNDPSADGVSNLRTSLERVLSTAEADTMAVQKYDVRRPDADGAGFEVRYWSPVNSPVHAPDGSVSYIIHRVEDVTEFVRLKQAGREHEEFAHALQTRAERVEAEVFQRAQQVAEANRQLTRANDALARLYRQITTLMARVDEEPAGGAERADRSAWPMAPEEMLSRVEQLILGHQRLEEQLRQSQKMEAVGRLAGGVAHDFNNLLSVITGYASMLRDRLGDSESPFELEEIQQAVVRAASLTHKLLAFSRSQILQPRVIDLNGVVRGMEEMLRRLIGEDVALMTVLGGDLGSVKADPHQIEQVVMNLAVNARDAMPGGGRLVIETSRVHLDQPFQSLLPGEYMQLTVSDTGQGMDAETAARIFEPFFTTKEVGKGTGLGLSTVYGIVEQSGGAVTVTSSPGAGAKFQVYLPVCRASEPQVVAEKPAAPRTGRQETILLVEDEPPLRKLVSAILAKAGYRVLETSNGDEAASVAAKQPQIDLLLTDVIMPGMSGPDLAARLRQSHSGLMVLFMSGYDRDLVDEQVLSKSSGFLPKPFTPHALQVRVGELLGKTDLKRRAAQ